VNTFANISKNVVSLCHYGIFNSGVKYLSKTTLKYYLSSYLGYLYFTIHVFDSFYFTTFLKTIMYFLLHTFSNSSTYQEDIPGHPYCLWSGGLMKHKCFVCKWCLSFVVCPWLSVN
jgi:hypothetical protein